MCRASDEVHATSRRRRQLLAAFLGVLTAFLMSAMALTAKKAVEHGGTPMLVVMVRGLVGWLFACIILIVRRAPRDDFIGPPHTWRLLAMRVVVGTAALALFLLGLPLLPLGDLTALFLTNQIWTALMARLFFGEALKRSHAIGLAIALPGALLIVQPSALFAPPSGVVPVSSPAYAPLLPIGAAVGAAGAYVSVQACAKAGAPRSAIVHCFSVGSALLGGVALLFTGEWRALSTSGPAMHGLLVLCGVFAFAAQTALTAAIQLDGATIFSITQLSEVAFAFVWDAAFFGVHATKRTLLGALLTAVGVLAASLLPPRLPVPRLCCGTRRTRWRVLDEPKAGTEVGRA